MQRFNFEFDIFCYCSVFINERDKVFHISFTPGCLRKSIETSMCMCVAAPIIYRPPLINWYKRNVRCVCDWSIRVIIETENNNERSCGWVVSTINSEEQQVLLKTARDAASKGWNLGALLFLINVVRVLGVGRVERSVFGPCKRTENIQRWHLLKLISSFKGQINGGGKLITVKRLRALVLGQMQCDGLNQFCAVFHYLTWKWRAWMVTSPPVTNHPVL